MFINLLRIYLIHLLNTFYLVEDERKTGVICSFDRVYMDIEPYYKRKPVKAGASLVLLANTNMMSSLITLFLLGMKKYAAP